MRRAPRSRPPLKMAVKGGYEHARERIVAEQGVAPGTKDPLVLDAMRAVPREEFEWVAFVPIVGAHGWPADATAGVQKLPEPQKGRLKRWQP